MMPDSAQYTLLRGLAPPLPPRSGSGSHQTGLELASVAANPANGTFRWPWEYDGATLTLDADERQSSNIEWSPRAPLHKLHWTT